MLEILARNKNAILEKFHFCCLITGFLTPPQNRFARPSQGARAGLTNHR